MSKPTASPNSVTGPKRVLCVDDNVDACTMLGHLLRLQGHDVKAAHTGPTAIECALSWRPDVVLMDIGLPGLDGYEVAGRLRTAPENFRGKLIAISGYDQESDTPRARQAGFDAHLLKPVDIEELRKLLAAL